MTTLVLVRHGHVEGIEPERFRGRTDLPLSGLGREQAQRTAERVAARWRPTAVYCSPLTRCVATADAIATPSRLTVQRLDALSDLDYGDWTWKTHAEVRAAEAALFERWLSAPDLVRFPRGESLQELAARAADVLRRLVDEHLLETVVVVGHAASIARSCCRRCNCPLWPTGAWSSRLARSAKSASTTIGRRWSA